MNDVLRLMRGHRSIRAFDPTPLAERQIQAAVEAAQCAATSSWIQAYCLIQVVEAGERARLAELSGGQRQVEEAGAFFVLCADHRRNTLVAERDGAARADNLETSLLAIVDATLFAQNLTLAFESMGYGTCMIGGLRNRLPEVDQLLELPKGVLPLFGICVGKPLEDPVLRPRLEAQAVWSKGRYPTDDQVLAAVARHDERAAHYYAERGLEGRTWSAGVQRKFTQPHRIELASYYRSKGASFD